LKKESLILIVTRIRAYFKQIREQTLRYVKGNWGFPFITAFLILLFAAALQNIVAGEASLAELTAIFAYFALALGVVLQLVYFIKNRSKNGVMH
jgi:hypothetical protein